MTDLNANVDATQEWLPLTDADSRSLADGFYTIDTENVKVENGPHPATSLSITPYNGRRAVRGVGGSTAASHLSGATLTRYYPDAVGGGASGLPDPAEAPDGQVVQTAGGEFELAALTLAEVLAAGNDAGEQAITGLQDPNGDQDAATKFYVDAREAIISDTDPGESTGPDGANRIWVRTYPTAGLTPPLTVFTYPAYVRNDADSGWLSFGSAAVDEAGNLRAMVQFDPEVGGLNLFTYQADGTIRSEITMNDAGIDTWWHDDDGNIRTLLNVNGGFGVTPSFEAQINDDTEAQMAGFLLTPTSVTLDFAQGTHTVILNASGVTIDTSANVKMPNLPTADPVVAGALWNDTNTVKVSAG